MIPVYLADDETLIRDAMATMLDLDEGIEVVAHVGSGEELVDLAWWPVDALPDAAERPGIPDLIAHGLLSITRR